MPGCAKCGGVLAADLKIGRQTICPHCSAYLHACVQCALHDPSAHNQCREPQAEFVGNREKANFCDFFQFAAGGSGAGAAGSRERKAQDARDKLEALFKKPAADDDADA